MVVKKLYVIAGESSGDLQAADLLTAMRAKLPQLSMRGRGGDRMKEAGVNLDAHFKETAFMGFTDVALNLRKIKKALKKCQNDIIAFKPDLILLVDYPGFNMRIARFANELNIPVAYYIPPKVWAWRKARIRSLKKYCTQILSILPFEKEYYRKEGIDIVYEGNPLFDRISPISNPESSNKIVLLPGSRAKEVSRILPDMIEAKKSFDQYEFIVAGTKHLSKKLYKPARDAGIRIEYNRTYELLAEANMAVVASGTATLETALFNIPQVVVYRLDTLSAWIARRVLKLKYVSLVNLIEDKEVVRELLQDDFNPKLLVSEMRKLEKPDYRKKQQSTYAELRQKLGPARVSDRLAAHLVNLMN